MKGERNFPYSVAYPLVLSTDIRVGEDEIEDTGVINYER